MEYQEIIKLILNKDKAGLEALYNLYGRKFYNHAVNRWNLSEDDAWEVVYQTLETLVLKLPDYEFESKAHFDNFIFKVFTNFLRQFYRKYRLHQVAKLGTQNLFNTVKDEDLQTDDGLPLDFEIVESLEANFSFDHHGFTEYYETEIVENPKLILLRKALEQLDEVERDILLLRAQDYSYDEIAKMLKIENKQLKVKHHRIKSRLILIMNKNTLLNEHK